MVLIRRMIYNVLMKTHILVGFSSRILTYVLAYSVRVWHIVGMWVYRLHRQLVSRAVEVCVSCKYTWHCCLLTYVSPQNTAAFQVLLCHVFMYTYIAAVR